MSVGSGILGRDLLITAVEDFEVEYYEDALVTAQTMLIYIYIYFIYTVN